MLLSMSSAGVDDFEPVSLSSLWRGFCRAHSPSLSPALSLALSHPSHATPQSQTAIGP